MDKKPSPFTPILLKRHGRNRSFREMKKFKSDVILDLLIYVFQATRERVKRQVLGPLGKGYRSLTLWDESVK